MSYLAHLPILEDKCLLKKSDIKIYNDPIYDEDGVLIDAAEINSYYSAFEEPLLIIKEVAKNYE